MRASVLYNDIANASREKGNLDEALEYYEVALDCVRKA